MSGATWLRVLHRVRRAQGLGATWATRRRTRPRVLRAAPFEGNLGPHNPSVVRTTPPLEARPKKSPQRATVGRDIAEQ